MTSNVPSQVEELDDHNIDERVEEFLQTRPRNIRSINFRFAGLKGSGSVLSKLSQFENLERIDLRDNNLDSCPDFREVLELRTLDLSGNPITLNNNISSLVNINKLPPLTEVHTSEHSFLFVIFISLLFNTIYFFFVLIIIQIVPFFLF